MQSAGFDVISCAGERATRDTLRYFGQVRGFFAQAIPAALNGRTGRVRIVAFGSQKEYAPYRAKDFAIAYYTQAAGYDYIVMGKTGNETFPIATHEYVHLVVQHAGLTLPVWLNEGLAEVYSTLRPQGPNILVGSLIPERLQALLTEPWTPLQTILDAGVNSPYYNETDKAGSLYNVGWALTHMLALSDDYRPRLARFLQELQRGTPSGPAMLKAYGKTVPQIEDELRAYVHGLHFKGVLIPATLEKNQGELRAEPADAYDVKLRLMELRDHPEDDREGAQILDELRREQPKDPEAYGELGYLALRHGRRDEAERDFARAVAAGAANANVLWDYGRMLEQRDRAASIHVLNQLVEEQPERLDARLELAVVQLANQQAGPALLTLRPIHKVTPADAPRLFRIMAYAQLQDGHREDARATAERLIQVARTPQDREDGERLLAYLSHPAARPAPLAQIPASGESVDSGDSGRPTLRHLSRVKLKFAASLTGTFLQLDCAGAQATVVIQTDAGKKAFLIKDPANVVIAGAAGATVDLTCGPQKPVQVQIEYDPPPAAAPSVDGVLRSIRFQP